MRALRRAAVPAVVLSIAALALSFRPIGTTLGVFNAETQNASSTFAGGWIDAASGTSAVDSGYDVVLAWTPGTHGPVTGQKLFGVDNGTTASCTGAAYSLLATLASPSTAAYTDTGRASGAANGNWFCYQLVSSSATVWTAQTALAPVVIGFVASGLATTNGQTAGKIDKNDTIKLTFNQRTSLGTTAIKVCVYSSGAIVLGDTSAGGGCPASPASTFAIGKITVAGATIGANAAFPNSTVTVSTSAPWTYTVKLAGGAIATVTGSPTWTLTPAATIATLVSPTATVCTAAKATCQPTATSSF